MNKPTEQVLGKKDLCNPPVLAAVESTERMIRAGRLSNQDILDIIDCDEEYISSVRRILKGAVDRLRG